MNAKKRVDFQQLRKLIPVCELTQDNLHDLAHKTEVERAPQGRTLFKKGDEDNLSFYLLSGEVVLDDGQQRKTLTGGSSQARYPLDHHQPRQATATAATEVEYVRIDNDLLDILLTWDQNAGYMVSEIGVEEEGDPGVQIDDDGDWMTNLLRSSLFHKVPPTNIQAIFMRMEAMPVQAGDLIIRQGEEGDYYYYIKEGKATVTRTSSKSGKELKLADLETGDSFGEEALVSGAKRNADVTMQSPGVLMRLSKQDFDALLKAPVLQTVDYEEAKEKVDGNRAIWLDVRLESEHKSGSLPGSIHIPLYLLRLKAAGLDKDKTYIVYCDTGRRSASAAYLLSERGFDVYVLSGGLMALKQGQGELNG